MTFFTLDNGETTATPRDKVLFRTANEFSMFITNTKNNTDKSYTQCILEYCEMRDIEPEDIAKLISKPLKEQLAIEMQEAGLLSRDSTAEFE
jgi:hypothetical protein